jgi:uncharacterized membrane protein
MMLAEPAAPGGARRYWWRTALVLSLALNLFFVAGALWIRIHAPPPAPSPEQRLEEMAGELGLDPQQRQAFERFSQTMRARLQAMHQAMQPLVAGAWAEVGKPQADEAKVMRLLDEAAETRRGYQQELTATTLAFLATLSSEQRAKFVQLARHRPHPWSPPRDHRAPPH